MSNNVQNINKIKTGTCPHGLSPGVCPICSLGGGTLKQSDRTRKIGEMTYHECAMIGNMLRARKLAQKNHENLLERWSENRKSFDKLLMKSAEQIVIFANQLSKNILFRPISFLIMNVAIPIINFVRNIPNVILNIAEKLQQIKQNFVDIMDKLTAIYGEIKNFIQKKVSELISTIKTKVLNLFKILKKHNTDDEDSKIDEDKKIFNLKKFMKIIFNKKKAKKNEQSRKYK